MLANHRLALCLGGHQSAKPQNHRHPRDSPKAASKLPKFTEEQIREFLRQECKDFCAELTSDPELARQEIQKRIKRLVLTPKETPEGTVLEVSGDVSLLRTGDVLVESPIQRTSQQYISASTPLAGIILNPAPLRAA